MKPMGMSWQALWESNAGQSSGGRQRHHGPHACLTSRYVTYLLPVQAILQVARSPDGCSGLGTKRRHPL